MTRMGARAQLMKTSQCASKAADIYPRVIRMMDEVGVPVLDRVMVLGLLMNAVGLGDGEDEPPVQRIN